MNTFKAYIQLTRPLNLGIIVLTQVLFWVDVVQPVYGTINSAPNLSLFQVLLLILSTVFIAAGGYVINDYYDLPIDLVNKPEKVIISRTVSDQAAFNYYIGLTLTGLACAVWVAIQEGRMSMLLLPVVIASFLWFYAQHLKRSPLIGNFVVAFSTASVILILLVFEIDWAGHAIEPNLAVNDILKFGAWYMAFAFVLTLLREVVKDLEDMEGDRQFECRTFPVVAGEVAAKALSVLWAILAIFGVGWLTGYLIRFQNFLPALYLFLLVVLPVLAVIVKVISARSRRDYALASKLIKFAMLFGVLSMTYIGMILS